VNSYLFFNEIRDCNFIKKKIDFSKIEYLSYYHGRELCIRLKTNSWLSIKGGGWNLGPPFYYHLKKKNDPECLGLLDYYNAKREERITNILNKKFKNQFPEVLGVLKIKKKLDISKKFKPALIFRIVTTPYRLTDLLLKNKVNALKHLKKKFKGSNNNIFLLFLKKTLKSVILFHRFGYVHDNIDLGNFNVHGQLLDLELFYIPGVKYPSRFYRANSNLNHRKSKEAIVYLEMMYKFSEILKLNYSITQIAKQCKKNINKKDNLLFFCKTIMDIAKY
jgi:hypothetical protein